MAVEIPERYQQAAREFAQVCKRYGLREFSGTFRTGYGPKDEKGWDTINFGWREGRHGADGDEVSLGASATAHMVVKVKP